MLTCLPLPRNVTGNERTVIRNIDKTYCFNIGGLFIAFTKCLTNIFTLSVANILSGLVALPHSLIKGLLLEGDGTRLKDWVLLVGCLCLLLVHTTQPVSGSMF